MFAGVIAGTIGKANDTVMSSPVVVGASTFPSRIICCQRMTSALMPCAIAALAAHDAHEGQAMADVTQVLGSAPCKAQLRIALGDDVNLLGEAHGRIV